MIHRACLFAASALALLLAFTGPAMAATGPVFELTTTSPTNAQPGVDEELLIVVRNIGDENAGGPDLQLTVDLPEGLTGLAQSPEYPAFSCPGIAAASEFTCTASAESFPRFSPQLLQFKVAVHADAPPGPATVTYGLEGGGAPSADTVDPLTISPTEAPFGIEAFDVLAGGPAGEPFTQAGGHPWSYATDMEFNTHANPNPIEGPFDPVEDAKNVLVDLPPGFVGNPAVVPQCTLGELANAIRISPKPLCAPESQIGLASIRTNGATFGPIPLFNMEPPPGAPARFGFNVAGTVVVLDSQVRGGSDYGITVAARNISQGLVLDGTSLDFWGVPADESHEAQRFCPGQGAPWEEYGEACSSNDPPRGFFRMPTSCTAPGEGLPTTVRAESWQDPGQLVEKTIRSHAAPGFPYPEEDWGPETAAEGCGGVPFEPGLSVKPMTNAADSPSGLEVDLSVPQDCWGEDEQVSICQSDLKGAEVTLPAGMSINPSAADGLGACTESQIGYKPGTSGPFEFTPEPPSCPASSKIGKVEIDTPLLNTPLKGAVYLAEQDRNPFGSLLAIYFEAEGSGVVVKQAGEIDADPGTGRLTTRFADAPQTPFSNLHLELFGGPRAALRIPPDCGTYTAEAKLTPWARPDEPVSKSSSFQIDQGCGGGFDPKLSAGTENPLAGTTSPFSLRLTREDGTQELGGISATLPPGLTGYLRGIPYCSDAALAAVSEDEGTGAAQEASPSCPAASQLGTVTVGAGAGANPFYTTAGRAYLAGPYKGAPLSIAVVTPAVAGPFDLGSVVVRNALKLDPETAQITAVSDPLPTILHGIPLDLRDVRVELDRPSFTLNPTSCDAMSIASLITSTTGATATPSERFQVAGCGNLAFKPSLKLRLKGKTNRGAHPALSAVLRARPGDANIGRLAVTLPKTELLENAHIRTTCTRVQFAAGGGGGEQCPQGSIYGHVKATSPLVDYTLEGPVFLRSSSHKLPDLVAVVKGPSTQPLIIAAVGRIDTIKGRIRTSFETFPDTPISKVVLTMQGGKKGLLVNERELCRAKPKASVQFDGQNGKVSDGRPLVRADCGRKRGRKATR